MDQKPQLLEMLFPAKGLELADKDISLEPEPEFPETTSLGQNVRVFEVLSDRGRGGQRGGLSRYIDQRVNGVGVIQHLNTVVRADGAALGFAFQGLEFSATGLYLGLNLTTPVTPTGGGGGYQPSAEFNERYHGSLTVSDLTVPADGTNATVSFTILDD